MAILVRLWIVWCVRGENRGSRVVSRIANLYSERFVGFAFLALGYTPPAPETTFEDDAKRIKQALGRETLGYQLWFSEEGTAQIIEKNFDSFQSLVFPVKPELWIDHMGPKGAAKKWVESGRVESSAGYITEEDKQYLKKALLEGGLEAPLCWYKFMTFDLRVEEDKLVPTSSYAITVPVFFGAALKDFICVPALYTPALQEYAKGGLTIKDFGESDHWLPINESREDLNKALLEWIESLEG